MRSCRRPPQPPHQPALPLRRSSPICDAVVSPQFEGRRLLDRHKLVNAALVDLMPSIHALTIKAKTPAEHDKAQAAAAQ